MSDSSLLNSLTVTPSGVAVETDITNGVVSVYQYRRSRMVKETHKILLDRAGATALINALTQARDDLLPF